MAVTVKPAPQVDYTALLGSDPMLQAALGQIETRGTRQQIGLTAARQQALIGYGDVPDAATSDPRIAGLLGNVGADVTGETRDLARQSTESGLSTTAQLARDYKHRQGADVASLVGRGALRSGDYRRLSRENLQDYQIAGANALSGLLGNLGGLWQGFTGDQEQNAADTFGATHKAEQGLYDQIATGALGGGGTAPAASSSAAPKPAVPRSSVPVTVGSSTSYEPKPHAANLAATIAQPPTRRKPQPAPMGFRALR